MTAPLTVVIADDHVLFRQGLRQMLERAGDVEVTGEAANGREALALIEATRPAVAILDIRMPELAGHRGTLRRRSRGSDSPGRGRRRSLNDLRDDQGTRNASC